ncbi:MAG: ribonuclease P protein component [Candidatus Kapaibacterium sp.]
MNQHQIRSLKGEHAFGRVFRASKKIREPLLHLYVQFASTHDSLPPCSLLGIVVRKKVVRRAVDRARIKRWLRNAARRCAAENGTLLEPVGAMVVVWQAGYSVHDPDIRFHQVYESLVHGLKRAQRTGARG